MIAAAYNGAARVAIGAGEQPAAALGVCRA